MNRVFVLSSSKQPLMPCTPARARRLLDAGRAAVYRRTPFTLILQDRATGEVQPVAFQADPGSKITGIARVGDFPNQGRVVLWAANLAHRGEAVRKRLTDRRALRRSRRGRKTRYRSKRADNRTLPANWMPPSKHSRVGNVRTWCGRLLDRVPMSGAHIANRPKNTPENAADGNAIAVGAAVQACGLPVSFWSVGRTKRNRVNQDYPRAHWIDAACVGEDGAAVKLNPRAATLNIAATGRGRRQVVLTDEHGFPRGAAKRVKRVQGLQLGDLVRLDQTNGKHADTHIARLASIQANGRCNITTATGAKITANVARFALLQRVDGYAYRYVRSALSKNWPA
jgi:hypothetical protein